jgi:hypothetical protein
VLCFAASLSENLLAEFCADERGDPMGKLHNQLVHLTSRLGYHALSDCDSG